MTDTAVALPPGIGSRPLGAAEYAKIAREISANGGAANLRALRLGVLSSCSMQFVEPALIVEGARRGLQIKSHFGPFGQFEQLLSDPRSSLHAFDAQALLLFMRPEDLDVDFAHRFNAGDRGRVTLQSTIDRLTACVASFRQHSNAPILVANFATPSHLPLGPFDANAADSLTHALAEANHALGKALSAYAGTVVWDYAGLVREAGAATWTDARMWALARVPVASGNQPAVARHLARTLAALTFTPAKCLVLDLDNTLWGGVIGDDGIEGIKLGDDYPGNVFKSFQRAILGLTDRGILLAVVSKNYQSVVEEALRTHPEMLIRPESISAMRVNWQPKSQNLREIAQELNIGLDALVMFDDNPVERAEIAANAPEVRVVDAPAEPIGYERALYECGWFDMISVSQEDKQRVQMYRTERAREEVRATAHTVEDFLNSLEMVSEIGLTDSVNLARVAQLIGKTNQFNLTTRRHAQADVARMSEAADHDVVYMRLGDRFGDLGLIAVGIVAYQGEDAIIDTLVMSCRVMGRQVENGLVAELADLARAHGCRRLIGDYLPTPRNGMVNDLFPTLGFTQVGPIENDGMRYVLDLTDSTLEWPAAIQRNPTPQAR
jgi:FkbH-like protein